MKITNNKGLPVAIHEALSKKEYSKNGAHLSVTEAIDSPRVRMLKKLHDHEIEVESEALLASFLGTAFHKAIEVGTETGTSERRLEIEVNGWRLSGGMDHYHDGVLTDYKTCSTWKTLLGADNGRIEEFENQLNVYAHILRENGWPVRKLMLFAYFKDWNRANFQRFLKKNDIFIPNERGGYPKDSWVYFEVPLWKPYVAETYTVSRVLLHQQAEGASEENLPLCTRKEIWEGTRCARYCLGSKWCNQYQEQSKTGLMAKLKEQQQ